MENCNEKLIEQNFKFFHIINIINICCILPLFIMLIMFSIYTLTKLQSIILVSICTIPLLIATPLMFKKEKQLKNI